MGRITWECDQVGMGRAGWTTEKEYIPGLPNPSGTFPRNLSNGCHLFYDRVPRTASDLKHFGTGLVEVWRWVCLGINLTVVKPSRQGEERKVSLGTSQNPGFQATAIPTKSQS